MSIEAWPFGSFSPEESGIRKLIGSSNSQLIILFCIGDYYIATGDSVDILETIGYRIRVSRVRKKTIRYCLLHSSVSFDAILTRLPRSHIVLTKVL